MKIPLVDFLVLKKQTIEKTQVHILSGSMAPWIKTGEIIDIIPCELEDLKPFDIIVYWNSKSEILICHIFIKIRDNKIITKSLANNKEDPPVQVEYLLGKVIKPKFRWYHKLLLKINY